MSQFYGFWIIGKKIWENFLVPENWYPILSLLLQVIQNERRGRNAQISTNLYQQGRIQEVCIVKDLLLKDAQSMDGLKELKTIGNASWS